MKKKLFCFDLDMTLLDHKTYTVTESALQTLEKLKNQGHVVTIATGRDMDIEFSRPYKEMIQPTAIVHCNGQKVTVGDKKIHEVFMDKELVRELMEFAKEKDLTLGFNIGEDYCYVNPERVQRLYNRMNSDMNINFLDEKYLLTNSFYALAYIGDPAGAHLIEETFPQVKLPLFAGKEGADIIGREVAKTNGIHVLQDYYQIPDEDVVAFGDSMNDYEMVRDAGIGVAMGNAVGPLKEIADFVTRPIDEDGICYALEKLNL